MLRVENVHTLDNFVHLPSNNTFGSCISLIKAWGGECEKQLQVK